MYLLNLRVVVHIQLYYDLSAKTTFAPLVRGVQYVHLVMHKCIMVKVGGKIHVKYVKRCWIFWKQGGGNFGNRGEIRNFRESGGEML